MTPHWPSPLVAWILAGWTGALIVGTAVWWWLCRPTRDVRAAEDAKSVVRWGAWDTPVRLPRRSGVNYGFHIHGTKLPSRSGVNAMFDPGKETRP